MPRNTGAKLDRPNAFDGYCKKKRKKRKEYKKQKNNKNDKNEKYDECNKDKRKNKRNDEVLFCLLVVVLGTLAIIILHASRLLYACFNLRTEVRRQI